MDSEDKIANPTKYYTSPEDVVTDKQLSTEDQIKLLENWLDDIVKKQIAEEENMTSAGKTTPDLTERVQHELHLLQAKEQ